MTPEDRGLRRELVLVIALKLALLTALWWFALRDVQVEVDPPAAAARFIAPHPADSADALRTPQPPGDKHAQ
ncbi:cytochrome oxidase putative small subunit CydP [Aromatoleum petrolei]|uniref:Energy transducer TonB n=1 Tax=Aromatoleum petrolei TaxID=76116 RepID=A0ABX1MV17_9RHOO|nr:cytochrome oxidase putative small subunit CydP [Aromatoleum petrolei]NMF89924.1 hypothetical protein [Aromatoleum petrolei]